MRRKDREVTRHGDLMEMVARFKVCRLGLWDGREVYVVPLNFGYEEKNGSLSLFFHCAREGRKLDILQNRPEVSFEMDGDHVLLEGDAPCRYSYEPVHAPRHQPSPDGSRTAYQEHRLRAARIHPDHAAQHAVSDRSHMIDGQPGVNAWRNVLRLLADAGHVGAPGHA